MAGKTGSAGKKSSKTKPAKKSILKKNEAKKAAKKTAAPTSELKSDLPCIVGIGASAGGLEALEGFFSSMPSGSNMAFVVIQHLAPGRKSIMSSLLSKYTDMRILEIKDGMKIESDCVYLNPPDRDVSVMGGTLYLTPPVETHAQRLPIDHFFRSLAQDQHERGICIILSGTATDGTLGLKAVKGEGGMTMAQEESQAKYDGMPRSAINTGLVDFILPVEKMPQELVRYIKHPYIKRAERIITPKEEYLNTVRKIFLIIRAKTGHDFSHYKQNTIQRRIERRMAVHQLTHITDYLRYLRDTPAEVETLYRDMLITVTNFFRDPEAFDVLNKNAVIPLLEGKDPDSDVRIWVPGCATGEEAYSLAILFLEAIDRRKKHINVQIFATDIDDEAVNYARAGIYPDSIAADVSPDRLKKFFTKVDHTYAIKKQIRELVVFASQNLIKDPPFSRLDLVSCRNVLIYMDSVLQKKVLPLFHYTLLHDGILFLGTSESVGEFSDYFSPVSTKWKIFKRKGILPERAVERRALPFFEHPAGLQIPEEKRVLTEANVRHLAESVILHDYAPACVLINEKYDIIYFHGMTDTYLSPPVGEASFNILKMARNDLRYHLSTMLHKALKEKTIVASEDMQIKHDGHVKTFRMIVRPLAEPAGMRGLMMIVFEEKPAEEVPSETKKMKKAGVKGIDPRIARLEDELQSTKEYLQTTVEQLETSNEELKSTNEELQSTNEELQSTNEEMETSKEELQSTNEELETVNSELQSKVSELSRANNDLNNLLASTEIGTIFLDTSLNISRFTPSATRIFNLISTDIGRPIGDITSKTGYNRITEDARDVLDTLVMKEHEIETADAGWFNMRLMPYRTVDNVIDGVVITFMDVTELKRSQISAQQARAYAEGVIETIREPLLVLDADFRVISANSSFYSAFRVSPKETVKNPLFDLGSGQWNIAGLKKLLREVLPESKEFKDFKVEHDFPAIGKKTMLLNARQIFHKDEKKQMILLAFEDITENKHTGNDKQRG